MRIIENLVPGEYYHIYNRGINKQDIFRQEDNYRYFLKLYAKHVTPVAETFCYCLLKNHFHFLVRIKEEPYPNGKLPHRAFGNFLNAYAQGFNKSYDRTGSLFEKPFKRKCINDNGYFTWLVWYIHSNPQKHMVVGDFKLWPHSSYHSILSDKETLLKKEELIDWFDSIDYYIKYHQQQNGENSHLTIE